VEERPEDEAYPHTRVLRQVSEEEVCLFDEGVPRRVADLTEETGWANGVALTTEVTLRWGRRYEELFADRPSAMRFVRDNTGHFLAGDGILRRPDGAAWWYTPEGQRAFDRLGDAFFDADQEWRVEPAAGNAGWVTDLAAAAEAEEAEEDEDAEPPPRPAAAPGPG
jgi:hypothetical protein